MASSMQSGHMLFLFLTYKLAMHMFTHCLCHFSELSLKLVKTDSLCHVPCPSKKACVAMTVEHEGKSDCCRCCWGTNAHSMFYRAISARNKLWFAEALGRSLLINLLLI